MPASLSQQETHEMSNVTLLAQKPDKPHRIFFGNLRSANPQTPRPTLCSCEIQNSIGGQNSWGYGCLGGEWRYPEMKTEGTRQISCLMLSRVLNVYNGLKMT